jgi:hypothetical protein
MAIFTLSFRVDASSSQRAVVLRDRLAALLEDEDEVTLISASQAQDSSTYTVTGVDTATKEPFADTVEASDADAAREAVATKTKLVAEARPAV